VSDTDHREGLVQIHAMDRGVGTTLACRRRSMSRRRPPYTRIRAGAGLRPEGELPTLPGHRPGAGTGRCIRTSTLSTPRSAPMARRLFRNIPDGSVEAQCEFDRASATMHSVMHLCPINGAVNGAGADDTASACRDATFSKDRRGRSRPGKDTRAQALSVDYWGSRTPTQQAGPM
jgi:hypothetical protein